MGDHIKITLRRDSVLVNNKAQCKIINLRHNSNTQEKLKI